MLYLRKRVNMNKKICEDCTGYPLKEIPKEVYDIIIDRQSFMKKHHPRKEKKALDRVIYNIIREWHLLKNSKPVITQNSDQDFYVLIPIDEMTSMRLVNAIHKKKIEGSVSV